MRSYGINKNMVPMDENGHLDINLLKKLPLEDKLEIQSFFTPEQWSYYCNKTFTPNGTIKEVLVEYSMEDEEDWGWGVGSDKFFLRIKEKLKNDSVE